MNVTGTKASSAMKHVRNLKQPRRRQRGSVAALTGLALLVLVGMLGLVLDLGHLYIARTELQNAADACALGAARELSTFNASTKDRATSAGIAAGASNKVNLQATAADIQEGDITFSSDLAVDGNGNLMNFTSSVTEETVYVRCQPHYTNRLSVAMWVMQVFGIVNQNMYAFAVAKQLPTQTYCAVPLAVCSSDPDAENMNFTQGDWYKGRLEAGTATQGNYGWVRFPDQDTGTSALSDMIAGNGMCDLSSTTTVYQNRGVGNGASKAWNTRFGLYGAPYKQDVQTMLDHKPDKTGWSYQNHVDGGVYNDFKVKQDSNTPYDPMNMVDSKGKPIEYPGTPAPLSTLNHQRYGDHRRLVAMPVIRCSSWDQDDEKKAMQVVGWTCSLMVAPMEDAQTEVRLEFRSLVGEAPCAGAATTSSYPKLVR